LGNVYGKPSRETVRFLEGVDIDRFVNYYNESLFVVVALHELIGHGSGKLFIQDKEGKLNFENVINPFTKEPVTTYYLPNEHWHAKFGELSGAYEECRADSVALYLSTYDDVV
jgi:dipeptidyl-peptidase-3